MSRVSRPRACPCLAIAGLSAREEKTILSLTLRHHLLFKNVSGLLARIRFAIVDGQLTPYAISKFVRAAVQVVLLQRLLRK